MLFLFLFFNCLNYSNTFETNKKFKNSIINNKFSEHIEGFRGTIQGNGRDYKNINSVKVYEVVGDAYYNTDFFLYQHSSNKSYFYRGKLLFNFHKRN